MRYHELRSVHRLSAAFLVSAACVAGTGCVSPWWNGFLTPHEVGNFRDNRVNEIQRAISFRDKPLGIAGAVDPTPEDLVASVEEYKIGAGDALSIRMVDYFQLGADSELNMTVDELGFIHVPQLGGGDHDWLHVEGMTLRQLQEKVVEEAKNAGIYAAEASPTVIVQTLNRQQRLYNIGGAINNPGPYPIVRPDFRLREAINQAGMLDPNIRFVYVFRNETRSKVIKKESSSPARSEEDLKKQPAPPVTPTAMSEMAVDASPPAPVVAAEPKPATRSAVGPATASPSKADAEKEIQDAVAPGNAPVGTPKSPVQGDTTPSGHTTPVTIISVDDGFAPATGATPGGATRAWPATKPLAGPPSMVTPVGPASRTSASNAAGTVDWEALAAEGQQRVIRIPADRLRIGDPNYNIVVHHQDWIELDPGSSGVFYMTGHVLRPGVYSLNGNEITLTQALAAAGGLDQLAWPSRCEIRRRIDGDREEITQWDLSRIVDGQDPDLFIKKDDVVNVGTHAIAPLLATIRNAFRFTYGFGFVYDRNFADIDAYNPKYNPTDVRRAQRQSRGLLN